MVGEENGWDHVRRERYLTRMEERFLKRVGRDSPEINRRLKRVCTEQTDVIVARADGYCCWFRFKEWWKYKINVPEEWNCCEKEPPADWELTWDPDMLKFLR